MVLHANSEETASGSTTTVIHLTAGKAKLFDAGAYVKGDDRGPLEDRLHRPERTLRCRPSGRHADQGLPVYTQLNRRRRGEPHRPVDPGHG
ncbi:hypothetical protein DFAR_2500028 [Desulfarculales bacterium]